MIFEPPSGRRPDTVAQPKLHPIKPHNRISMKDHAIPRLAACLMTALTMMSCLPATVAAAEPPLTAVERAAHFEEALLRAKATGKDIVVLQRGSD